MKAALAPDRYAVIGQPVAHSLSPQIHREFAHQCGQNLHYEALAAPLDGFAATLAQFWQDGGRGLNVTVPFKLEACALADEKLPRAAQAGAANTLFWQDGKLVADNTDGVGLVRDLQRLQLAVRGQRIALLGAGGAARGVLGVLLAEAPAHILVVNRTLARAEALAADFAALAHRHAATLAAGTFDALAGGRFALLLNATSAALSDQTLPIAWTEQLLQADGAAYDLLYGAADTPFMAAARAQGVARVEDGLGMLVEQAAESFWRWRAVRPHTAPVLAQLRRQLQQATT